MPLRDSPVSPIPASAPAFDSTEDPSVAEAEADGVGTSSTSEDAVDEADLYLPGTLLTSRAEPEAGVLLLYPEFEGDAGTYVAVVALFIDEEGTVRRIRIEPPGLPEPLEAAVRRAFLPVRFQPARVDDRPVRELKRVEVRFDRTEIQAP